MRTRTHRKDAAFVQLMCMLIVLIVVLIISAMAMPNLGILYIRQQQNAALLRVQTIAQAIVVTDMCNETTGCIATTAAMIPAAGSTMQIGIYKFVFTQSGNNWIYTATPVSAYGSPFSIYVDQTFVTRCAWLGSNTLATATTAVCP